MVIELPHVRAPHSHHARLLIGIWLASSVAVPTVALGCATGVAILGLILWRRERGLRWMFVLVFAATLGALRYDLAQPHFDQTSLATYNDQQRSVIVEGVVVGEPDAHDARDATNLRVEADRLIITDPAAGVTRTVKGFVLIQAPPFTDFRYGDRIRAEGTRSVQTPTSTSEFDDREYLARQGVYSIMSRPRVTVLAHDQGFAPFGWLAPFTGCAFKARAKKLIAQTHRVPDPQASLLTGILLGDDAATCRRHPQECAGDLPHDGHIPYHRDQRLDVKPNRMWLSS